MIQSVKIPTAHHAGSLTGTSQKNSEGRKTLSQGNFKMATGMQLLATVLMALVTYDHSGAPEG